MDFNITAWWLLHITIIPYCGKHLYLVGGLEHEWIMTFHILGIIIPTDELHHFSEGLVGKPPSRLYRLDPHPHIIPYLPPCQVSCRIHSKKSPADFSPVHIYSLTPSWAPPSFQVPIFIPSKTFRLWPRRIRFVWWRQPLDLACPAVTLQWMALRTPSTATRWQAGWPTATSAATKPGARGPTGGIGVENTGGVSNVSNTSKTGGILYVFFELGADVI